MARIEITLKSDLCNASGEGLASVIDTDIVADEYGIPYIPTRRIKGCLLDAAKDIGIGGDVISKIFGISGTHAGSLQFASHAKLRDYDEIKSQVADAGREEVLNIFAYTRAATAIDPKSESAKENSLRFTRVVKQYSPVDNTKPFQFVAECEIDPLYNKDMERICKALRNIGYKRNRGFGAVRCEFIPDSDDSALIFPSVPRDDSEYAIPIILVNETPLMISANSNDETLDYIPGTSVHGAFASEYPKKDGESWDDFADLFLKHNIKFSNCYVGNEPAPLCYAKEKHEKNVDGTDKYINLVKGKGVAAKPLKNKYVTKDFHVIEPKKEVVYHNSTMPKGEDNTNEIVGLYMQSVLSDGQLFNGTISGTGKHLNELKKSLSSNRIRVGKSKTAQYSYCRVTFGDYKPVEKNTVSGKIAVILNSDVLILKNGTYTTDIEALVKELGITSKHDDKTTTIAYTVVSGYSGVFNLKKPQGKAFKKGSVLVFDDVKEPIESSLCVGERQNEGFGLCEVVEVGRMGNITEKDDSSNGVEKADGAYSKLIKLNNAANETKKKAIEYAKETKSKFSESITDTQIGRLRSMLKESSNYSEFKDRIKNIKSESVRQAAERYFTEKPDYKLFWDIVLQWHRLERKIESKKEKQKEKKEVGK